MLGNQEWQAPAWDASETGRQVGVLAGPEYSGQAGQDPREDWSWTQTEGQLVENNLIEDNLMNEIEAAKRMEESRSWSYGAPWSKTPNSTFREPEYRDHDMVPPVGDTTLTTTSALLGSTPAPHTGQGSC